VTLTSGQPKLPLRLGRYEVGATLAGGGMARVLVGRTWNDDGSERLVALKVIHDSLEDQEEFVHMFLDEGRLLSRIVHPNVVRTLEVGVNGSVRYIAMELLLGRSLFDVWELGDRTGKRLPVDLAAYVCAEVAAGLQAAHELCGDDGETLHLVHRDVNPSNIILTFAGEVKLIDFGLAKSRGQRTKSQTGIVKGKLPYLAPEQVHMEPIDRRVDVFSLGATLWEITTGKRLFKRESDLDTLRAVRDGTVPAPSSVDPTYPAELEAIVLKALARDPNDRFPTAVAMGEALRAFAEQRGLGDPVPRLVAFLGDAFPGEQAAQSQRTHAPRSVPPPSLEPRAEGADKVDPRAIPAPPPPDPDEEPIPLSSSLLGELPDDDSQPGPLTPTVTVPPPLVIRDPASGVGDQGSGIRDQGSGIRDQRAGGRDPEPKAEEPAKKAEEPQKAPEPAKTAAEPAKKADPKEPSKKAEESPKRADEPAKKADAHAKKADAPAKEADARLDEKPSKSAAERATKAEPVAPPFRPGESVAPLAIVVLVVAGLVAALAVALAK